MLCSLPIEEMCGRDALSLGLVLLMSPSISLRADGGLEDKESDIVSSGIDDDDEDDGNSTGNTDGGDSRVTSTSILSAGAADDSKEAGVDAITEVIGTLV